MGDIVNTLLKKRIYDHWDAHWKREISALGSEDDYQEERGFWLTVAKVLLMPPLVLLLVIGLLLLRILDTVYPRWAE